MNMFLFAGMDRVSGWTDLWWVLPLYHSFGVVVGLFNAKALLKQWRESDEKTNYALQGRFWDGLYYVLGVVFTSLVWPIVVIEPVINAFRGGKK